MDESLEREAHDHSNALEFCQRCLVRFQDRTVGGEAETYCPQCGDVVHSFSLTAEPPNAGMDDPKIER